MKGEVSHVMLCLPVNTETAYQEVCGVQPAAAGQRTVCKSLQ